MNGREFLDTNVAPIYEERGCQGAHRADVVAAIDLHRLHRLSIWDALVVRAALNGACTTLNTEDMQSGYLVERLAFRNPFQALS